MGIKIDVEKFSFHTAVGHYIVHTVDVFSLCAFISLLSVVLSIISPQGIREIGETFHELAANHNFFQMKV